MFKILDIDGKSIGEISPEAIRRLQFLELMEGTYTKEKHGPLLFTGKSVQAVLISFGDTPEKPEIPNDLILGNFFPKEICCIFPFRDYITVIFDDTPETAVKNMIEKFFDYLEKTGCRPILALGRCFQDDNCEPGSSIRKTCREAEDLMGKAFFYREKKFLSLDDVNHKDTGDDPDIGIETEKLCAYIQVIDHDKIHQFFHDLEKRFFHSGMPPQEIRQECITLLIKVNSVLVNKIPSLKEMPGNSRETFDAIMKRRFLGDIMDVLAAVAVQTSELLPLMSADSKFQRIISYVKNNYNQDLRLEMLGRLFNYNCAYLGKRFKENTGKNFHAYLDMLRMDAAKELLQTTSMKVYEISSVIGYSNTDYFYSKFRKYTGKSPLDFKKKKVSI